MFRKKSLAYKLSFYILTGVLLIVLIILFYNYQVSKKLMLKNAEENAYNLTQATVHKIENILLTTQKIPENVAYIIENSEVSSEELKNFLKMVVENNEEVFGSCIAFEPYSFFKDSTNYAPYFYRSKDSIIFKNLGNNNYDYFNHNWYKLPKQLGPLWSEPYFDEGGGNIIMSTFSMPFYRIKNGKKQFRGVVTADISLEWLDSLMNNLKIYETGYAFLISQNGTIITHPETPLILDQTIFSVAKKYNRPDLMGIGEEMVQGKSDFIPYKSMILKGKYRLYYAPLPVNKWSIGVIFPEKELFADLNSLATWLVLLGGFGIMALFILIVIISRNITNPIRSLAKATRKIGTGNFNVQLPKIRSNDEIAQLTGSFNIMQQQLNDYMLNLKETTAAKEKIESELKIAHDIQQGIIPKTFPPFPQRDDVDIYAVLDPAKEVGGDLYDFFFIDEDLLVFAIGDVSGKGVPSSLFMAITRTLLRARATKDLKVNEIVDSINAELCRDNDNAMFVTFFLGLIDLKSGEMNYCNAGHNYPYILRKNNELKCLDLTHGTPLGLFENKEYGYDSVVLEKNEFIVLYTDGITEAMDNQGVLFGEEGLEKTLKEITPAGSTREITDLLLKETNEFVKGAEQSDDITLLVLSFISDSPQDLPLFTDQLVISNDISELSKVNDFVVKVANKLKISEELLFDLKVVCEEVITNIIFYAF
ncbi:MAG: SpoIIE family protein phosphatase, partial [Desulfobacula sp.]|nr:SpoIIE family protein phosphatase [Desulfobacula sp.]